MIFAPAVLTLLLHYFSFALNIWHELRKLRQLEDENRQLKKQVADLSL